MPIAPRVGRKELGMKRAGKWPVRRVPAKSVGLDAARLERIGDVMRRAMAAKEVAGGIVAVVRRGGMAYLRFALALLNGGAWDGVRLLGRKTVALMTADQLPAGHPAVAAAGRGFGFGLGVSVIRTLGEGKQLGSVGEYGWGGAAGTQVWIDPSEQTIVMIMIQHFPKGRYTLMDRVKTATYAAIVDQERFQKHRRQDS